ncbi:fe2+ zn2+ uptake regulation protein [Pseudomonas sp.]|jgi:Fe2+ or Zn2+ uptake regulation protein|uniref:fe2+ zn2+ uptake regulation protein n=1 Tax=Pseudomonas sp. TaxID=306 RepID=UPI002E35D824|nr:fe2+ zn2+ uptake regulation protein [Pseudomonas sp.]HEX4550449.1 fe2+ zn2+ uptake regulation protein [Pseudomonas sp.]
MLGNQGSTSADRGRPFQASTHPFAFEFASSANRHIRQMLHAYGLRTSLFRLKVINALVLATQEQRVIGLQDLHAYIEASFSQLTIVGVREVLKRLAEVGVVTLLADRSYSFTPEAWNMLKPHIR